MHTVKKPPFRIGSEAHHARFARLKWLGRSLMAVALLATPAHELDGIEVPPHLVPKVAAVLGSVAAMADDLALRQRRLAGRIATVRAARRSGPAPNLLDRAG